MLDNPPLERTAAAVWFTCGRTSPPRPLNGNVMPPQSPTFGPLDEVLGTLLETWGQRYRFEMDREQRLLLLSKPPDIEVGAKELPDGRIHVVYQPSPDKSAEEYCSVERAILLINALMAREKLTPITLPSQPAPQPTKPATARTKTGCLAQLFRRK
jgi:hypothetical protein